MLFGHDLDTPFFDLKVLELPAQEIYLNFFGAQKGKKLNYLTSCGIRAASFASLIFWCSLKVIERSDQLQFVNSNLQSPKLEFDKKLWRHFSACVQQMLAFSQLQEAALHAGQLRLAALTKPRNAGKNT